MKDYELSTGPFSTRVHSDLELFQAIMELFNLKIADQEAAEELCHAAARIVAGNSCQWGWNHFSIRDWNKNLE